MLAGDEFDAAKLQTKKGPQVWVKKT